jgi:DNA-binding response OmpR family regulator
MGTNLFKTKSILIADDDTAYRENLRSVLARYFYEVYDADNGLKALELYREKLPDMIVTDINMPGLDGISLIKKIRSDDLKTRVIVTSAYPDQHNLLDAIPLHIVRFVVKPFEFPELLAAMTESFKIVGDGGDNILFTHRCDETGLIKECCLNRQNHTISCGDKTHTLTAKEYRLILALLQNDSTILSYETIEDKVWDGEFMSSNALRTLIKKVRQKTCKDFVKNVASCGYTVEINPA